jgi:hypothetical protein
MAARYAEGAEIHHHPAPLPVPATVSGTFCTHRDARNIRLLSFLAVIFGRS